jgi:DNA-directed RNA polymerase subunit K/omega
MGQRPMIKPDDPRMPAADIALKEVASGKLTAEMAFTVNDNEPENEETVISL